MGTIVQTNAKTSGMCGKQGRSVWRDYFFEMGACPGLCIMMMHAAILLTIQNRQKSLTAQKTEQNKVPKKENYM